MHRKDDFVSVLAGIVIVLFVVVVIFNKPISAIFVSSDKALQVAQATYGPTLAAGEKIELDRKQGWFVSWKGCDKGDVAVFSVKPFRQSDGTIVDNAMICAGWPFKGFTPRYR